MNKKWNLSNVQKLFSNNGCVLRESEYKNTKQRLKYVATCGHEHEISLDNFLAGKGRLCKKCRDEAIGKKKRLTYDDVKKVFESRGCRLISTEYQNNTTRLEYMAICGHKNKIAFSKFKDGGGAVCAKCSKSIKYEYDEVFEDFAGQGCVLLETEYINCKIPMRFIAECGHKSTITYDAFKNSSASHRCKECQLITHFNIEKIVSLFRDRGCSVLDTAYVPKKKIHYIAACGHRTYIALDKFIDGQGTNCPRCNKPRGEKHHAYNPLLTDEERIQNRDVIEYVIWRKGVFEKDGYTCRVCGDNRGGNLQAHHLNSYSAFSDERFDIGNGITLCAQCHKQYHVACGFCDSTSEKFNQWFKRAREYRGKAQSNVCGSP